MSMKNSNDTIGNRTRDLLTCSAVSSVVHFFFCFITKIILILTWFHKLEQFELLIRSASIFRNKCFCEKYDQYVLNHYKSHFLYIGLWLEKCCWLHVPYFYEMRNRLIAQWYCKLVRVVYLVWILAMLPAILTSWVFSFPSSECQSSTV